MGFQWGWQTLKVDGIGGRRLSFTQTNNDQPPTLTSSSIPCPPTPTTAPAAFSASMVNASASCRHFWKRLTSLAQSQWASPACLCAGLCVFHLSSGVREGGAAKNCEARLRIIYSLQITSIRRGSFACNQPVRHRSKRPSIKMHTHLPWWRWASAQSQSWRASGAKGSG